LEGSGLVVKCLREGVGSSGRGIVDIRINNYEMLFVGNPCITGKPLDPFGSFFKKYYNSLNEVFTGRQF